MGVAPFHSGADDLTPAANAEIVSIAPPPAGFGHLARHPHRNRQWPAHVTATRPGDSGLVDLEIGAAGQKFGQRDPGLQSRRRGPQAVVCAVAEGQNISWSAGDVQLCGVGAVLPFVAVGRTVEQEYLAAGRDGALGDRDVPGDGAGQSLNRGGQPKKFLNGVGHQLRLPGQQCALVGPLIQQLHCAAE